MSLDKTKPQWLGWKHNGKDDQGENVISLTIHAYSPGDCDVKETESFAAELEQELAQPFVDDAVARIVVMLDSLAEHALDYMPGGDGPQIIEKEILQGIRARIVRGGMGAGMTDSKVDSDLDVEAADASHLEQLKAKIRHLDWCFSDCNRNRLHWKKQYRQAEEKVLKHRETIRSLTAERDALQERAEKAEAALASRKEDIQAMDSLRQLREISEFYLYLDINGMEKWEVRQMVDPGDGLVDTLSAGDRPEQAILEAHRQLKEDPTDGT